jgi:hypothetical protein
MPRWTITVAQRFEESLLNKGFLRLQYDGSKPDPNGQLVNPSLTFYTRTYQVVLDKQPVNMRVRFVYNLRDEWADFDFLYGAGNKRVPQGDVDRMLVQASTEANEAKARDVKVKEVKVNG